MIADISPGPATRCVQLGLSRQRVLEEMQAARDPIGVDVLASRVGLHKNTTRFHLDALVEAGLAQRSEERAHRAGRPRVLYQATPDGAESGQRNYRLLAEILTGHLATRGRYPKRAAQSAGREWGRGLAQRPAPFRRVSASDATSQLTTVLTDIGFAPEVVTTGRATRIRLTHCPFLEIASQYQQVVCSVHHGLMQGVLDEIDAPIEAYDVEPFVEPTACLVHLRRRTDPKRVAHD